MKEVAIAVILVAGAVATVAATDLTAPSPDATTDRFGKTHQPLGTWINGTLVDVYLNGFAAPGGNWTWDVRARFHNGSQPVRVEFYTFDYGSGWRLAWSGEEAGMVWTGPFVPTRSYPSKATVRLGANVPGEEVDVGRFSWCCALP